MEIKMRAVALLGLVTRRHFSRGVVDRPVLAGWSREPNHRQQRHRYARLMDRARGAIIGKGWLSAARFGGSQSV